MRHPAADYLEKLDAMDTLHLITCGSVDDGKSTLIGRLLYDSRAVLADQLATLEAESNQHGTQGDDLDFSLLLDGLAAEREQGITIDIAWRFFMTENRRFIIADTPGHQEYTRNMATAASTATLAIILVDAEKGIRAQTHRHAMICHLMGIKQIVLAVNKIDKADYSQAIFERITNDFKDFIADLDFTSVMAIPLSALKGDMVIDRKDELDWYHGPTLMGALETASTTDNTDTKPFRMSVQWVCRPDDTFRGYAGRVASGRISVGDSVSILPAATTTRIASISIGDRQIQHARNGQSVMLTLADEVSVSRGDMIAEAANPPPLANQFEVNLIWLDDAPALVGRQVDIKIGTNTTTAHITAIKHRIDIETKSKLSANTLAKNDIGVAVINLAQPIAFDAYNDIAGTGNFIIIDRHSDETLAAGMICFALRRSTNIQRQSLTVTRAHRETLNNHRGCVYWLTGLSGAGKSTIANAFEIALNKRGIRTYLLDGDNLRHGINRDLGFTDTDRIENTRRIAEMAKVMVDAGLVVLVAAIAPFRQDRAMVREMFEAKDFVEIFVDTSLAVCEERDVKGLYKKARMGEIPNLTGIGSPYEEPLTPDCHLITEGRSVAEMATILLEHYTTNKQ